MYATDGAAMGLHPSGDAVISTAVSDCNPNNYDHPVPTISLLDLVGSSCKIESVHYREKRGGTLVIRAHDSTKYLFKKSGHHNQ